MLGEWNARAAALEETTTFRITLSTPVSDPALPSVPWSACRVPHKSMYVNNGSASDESVSTLRVQLSETKTELDALDGETYYTARDKVFPLAHCGVTHSRAKFQNRAGYKLEQVMTTTDMWPAVLTDRSDSTQRADEPSDATEEASRARHRRAVRFVDICGGPGAFSQAIFQCLPKHVGRLGFGLTLLDKHVGADSGWYSSLKENKNFVPCFGLDGTGDIYKPCNVESFVSVVGGNTCHLAVADGGFEVPPSQMAIQEALSARIVFAQWYVALRTLASGGCFVLKLFDTFTRFTRSLLYLSCCWFERVEIVKPLHSRAVNSERYLSCQGFRGVPARWQDALTAIHSDGFASDSSVMQLVMDDVMYGDAAFTGAVDASVASIATTQCAALRLVLDYVAANRASLQQPAADTAGGVDAAVAPSPVVGGENSLSTDARAEPEPTSG